jgi:short subunit dehydrogenase-like uncharacterized protein
MPIGKDALLIYGAYGYSGRLIVAAALRRGLKPIVAGRDTARTAALGRELGLPHRAFGLDDAATVRKELGNVAVVLNCAGPFSQTATALVSACMECGAHYLDITGECAVFEEIAGRDTELTAAGVMAMPGVGMDVVPSDCLALYLKQKLSGATRLELCIRALGQLSRGTANTFVEGLGKPNLVRVCGRRVARPAGRDSRVVTLAGERIDLVGLPWGDIATAWRSTGIPDISAFMTLPSGAPPLLRLAARTRRVWQTAAVQRVLKRFVQRLPEGPDEMARSRGHADFVGTVTDADGRSVRAHLRTPEGYALTAETSSEIARRVLAGEVQPGFRTPAMVFGADFILGFPGVTRTDL